VTPVDIRHMTAIYGNFVATSTPTFEIVSPDEAEMPRRWRAGDMPTSGDKTARYGAPKNQNFRCGSSSPDGLDAGRHSSQNRA
jgi:hypothetical protein